MVLTTAESLVNGERADTYGDPTQSFTRLAALWSATIGMTIEPYQVALCLAQLKISRIVSSPNHLDTYIDGAGYLGLGAEVASKTIDIND